MTQAKTCYRCHATTSDDFSLCFDCRVRDARNSARYYRRRRRRELRQRLAAVIANRPRLVAPGAGRPPRAPAPAVHDFFSCGTLLARPSDLQSLGELRRSDQFPDISAGCRDSNVAALPRALGDAKFRAFADLDSVDVVPVISCLTEAASVNRATSTFQAAQLRRDGLIGHSRHLATLALRGLE